MAVAKKKRLGRGLDALLSSTRLEEMGSAVVVQENMAVPAQKGTNTNYGLGGQAVIRDVPVAQITSNPYQPRQQWDEKKLFELAESIKANGLIQPVLLRPMGDKYQLIAGERRLKAVEMAGMSTIKAIIRQATEEQMLEWALVENIHRDDLGVLERAQAYKRYVESFSLTQQEAAGRLGEDRATIANYMRLLELDDEIKQMLNDKVISMGHARALLGLDGDKRLAVARMLIKNKWSVRQLEKQINLLKNPQPKIGDTNDGKPGHIAELEQKMTRAVGTKVTIKLQGHHMHRGKLTIEFYNLDDFDRISQMLGVTDNAEI